MTPAATRLMEMAREVYDEQEATNHHSSKFDVYVKELQTDRWRQDLRLMYGGYDSSWEQSDNGDLNGLTWDLIESAADAVNLGAKDEIHGL